ncbi:hypothetical protein [Thermocrinis sp.]|uniref:hypothetical protein n=1 Tax=Thermocrinis sp. TaxID=2024383 RepID=UPI003C079923
MRCQANKLSNQAKAWCLVRWWCGGGGGCCAGARVWAYLKARFRCWVKCGAVVLNG